jgi:D-sedoheptulose 7-phosphate isomerase
MEARILEALREHRAVVDAMIEGLVTPIGHVADRVIRCFRGRGKVLAMGNGGSAADAQHFVAELVGRFLAERRPLPALALTVDSSIVTAVSNDYGYAEVFARQVRAHARLGDVVFGVSTSGESANVCRGLEAARLVGASTVALGGCGGGRMRDLADLSIVVPSRCTARIQEAHITILHVICSLVDEAIAGDDERQG